MKQERRRAASHAAPSCLDRRLPPASPPADAPRPAGRDRPRAARLRRPPALRPRDPLPRHRVARGLVHRAG